MPKGNPDQKQLDKAAKKAAEEQDALVKAADKAAKKAAEEQAKLAKAAEKAAIKAAEEQAKHARKAEKDAKKHGMTSEYASIQAEEQAPLLSQSDRDDLRLQAMSEEVRQIREESLAIGRKLDATAPAPKAKVVAASVPKPEVAPVRRAPPKETILPAAARQSGEQRWADIYRDASKAEAAVSVPKAPAPVSAKPPASEVPPVVPKFSEYSRSVTQQGQNPSKAELDAREKAAHAGIANMRDQMAQLRGGEEPNLMQKTDNLKLSDIKRRLTDLRDKLNREITSLKSSIFSVVHKYEINTKTAKRDALNELLDCSTLDALKDKAIDLIDDPRVMRDAKTSRTKDLVKECADVKPLVEAEILSARPPRH